MWISTAIFFVFIIIFMFIFMEQMDRIANDKPLLLESLINKLIGNKQEQGNEELMFNKLTNEQKIDILEKAFFEAEKEIRALRTYIEMLQEEILEIKLKEILDK